MIFPSKYDAPRFTTSQQATPCAAASGCGSYFHLSGAPGWVRSRAYRMLGDGVATYIVVPTISGAASWPRLTPVENVHARLRRPTLAAVISFRPLNRVDA